jgi:crotonobetainyl-CoA:carnitine CoA-transferase CaiB-like acyl-CoA transferase
VSQLGALYAVKTIQIAAQHNPDTWEGYHCWGPYDPPDTGWQTKDRPIVFSFGEFTGGGPDKQSQWPQFCRQLGLEHLLQDARFEPSGKNSTGLGADAAALRAVYEAVLRQYPAAELIALVRRLEGAAYPYHTHATLLADAQARVLQLVQTIPGPQGELQAVKTPWNFSALRPGVRCGPPALGNATGRVLAELGYDAAQRQQLLAAGSVAGEMTAAAAAPSMPPPPAPGTAPVPAYIQRPSGPLAGIRVLDISGLGVGPVTGLFLAELGAEVIKVEPPHGDLALTVLPRQRGTSVLYISANVSKRGVILNLKNPADLERAYRLAERSDVFLENFRVGVVERLGLGYAELARRNPRLVYCSLSGFGPHGPLALLPSVDTYIQAFSGFASLNGQPGSNGESLRNIGFIDLSTSAMTVPAILAALIQREHTGQGQHIVASMLEAAAMLQVSRMAEFFATGRCATPHGSGMPYAVPDQAFRVRDGYLAVSARTQAEWQQLCQALGQEALLEDPRYRTLADRLQHRESLLAHLQAVFGKYPSAWWLRRLSQAKVPCGRFHTYDEMCHHPQVRLNGLMAELPTPHWGTVRVAGLPWTFSLTPGVLRPGPLRGSDTAAVLAEVLGEA